MKEIKKNVSYGNDEKQVFDIYFPEKSNNKAIIVVHGGGWWQGDKQKEDKVPNTFANLGYTVFVPNYRLAHSIDKNGNLLPSQEQTNLFPTQRDDVQKVFEIVENEYGFESVGMFGSSSGGNIAFEVANIKNVPVASWSGLMDFAHFMSENKTTTPEQRIIGESKPSDQIDQDGSDDPYYLWSLLNMTGNQKQKIEDADVLQRISKKPNKALLAVSENELVHSYEQVNLVNKLLENKWEVYSYFLPGSRHAEAYFDDIIDETILFFNKALK